MPEPSPQKDPPEVLKRFESGLPMADRMAARFYKKMSGRFQLDDLKSASRQGLWNAARRYDPERGVPFRGFAHLYIRGGIVDEIRSVSQLSGGAFHRALALRHAAAGHACDLSEAGLDIASLNDGQEVSAADAETALDALMSKFATATAVGLISDAVDAELEGDDNAEEEYQRREVAALVREEITKLPEREARVVVAKYFEHKTIDDLADEFGCDRSWVSRMHHKAMGRLTHRLRGLQN